MGDYVPGDYPHQSRRGFGDRTVREYELSSIGLDRIVEDLGIVYDDGLSSWRVRCARIARVARSGQWFC